jgi:hypothetical protein
LKTLGDNLFKLHTVVEDIKAECSVKEPLLYFAPFFELSTLLEKSYP